ncbi:MAG: DNA-processing protein DprA [Patescibacteria group bacterium]
MKYLNALNKISGVGPQKFKLLLNFFGASENIWKASLDDLIQARISDKLAEKVFEEKRTLNPDTEWEKLEKENIQMITLKSLDYPRLLKESANSPYIIYMKGDISILEDPAPLVSIVGSRKFTSYGAQATETLARDLANAGMTVVSGMALGIDTFAHRGALSAGGKTIAVLGNSLDDKNIYPRNNFNLSRDILENGLLLSEYPLETSAGPLTFPARNRIIAGLSLGTVVVEAGETSGALITAEMALEYNREVFAVPGPIFSAQSVGTNNLLRKGAKLVTGIKDILEELNLKSETGLAPAQPKIPASKEEEALLNVLSSEPLHIDNIAKISKLGTATSASTLSLMEIKGWAKNIGGQNYILT